MSQLGVSTECEYYFNFYSCFTILFILLFWVFTVLIFFCFEFYILMILNSIIFYDYAFLPVLEDVKGIKVKSIVFLPWEEHSFKFQSSFFFKIFRILSSKTIKNAKFLLSFSQNKICVFPAIINLSSLWFFDYFPSILFCFCNPMFSFTFTSIELTDMM